MEGEPGKGSILDLSLFLPSDLGYSRDCEQEEGGRGQKSNGIYTSLFFHSFMLRASQSPHPLYHWLTHPWDAPGTPEVWECQGILKYVTALRREHHQSKLMVRAAFWHHGPEYSRIFHHGGAAKIFSILAFLLTLLLVTEVPGFHHTQW